MLIPIVLAIAQVSAPVPLTPPVAVATDNPRLRAMFEADQSARKADPIDWTVLSRADEARRAEARRLLDSGGVRTALDYWHAAFLFQHGDTPRDYLLAHALAVTAIAKGKADAGWIAAATLDRYLGAIGQPQIYGTQFRSRPGEATTQEPYDRTLIGDDQRRAVSVPVLAEQEVRRRSFDAPVARPPVPAKK